MVESIEKERERDTKIDPNQNRVGKKSKDDAKRRFSHLRLVISWGKS